jgi:hypothetical protein
MPVDGVDLDAQSGGDLFGREPKADELDYLRLAKVKR